MPVAALPPQLVQSAVGRGHRDVDFASLILEQAARSGHDAGAGGRRRSTTGWRSVQ